jgi:methionyl-tRNA formyltransferase
MRLIFLGSPGSAVPFLEACHRRHEVRAVLTRPDRPSGRGLRPVSPPVKDAALRLGLRVLQPEDPGGAVCGLRGLGAEMGVVVAYGRVLSREFLGCLPLGFMNVHFSLLPRWRGAAPVAWSLLSGDTRTGVTLFWIEEALDEGPVQRAAGLDISPEDDALSLMERLVELGVREMEAALGEVSSGRVVRRAQAGFPTRAPKPGPAQAEVGFSLPAREIHNRVRALRGGRDAFLRLNVPGRERPLRLSLLKTRLEDEASGGDAGSIVRVERGLGVLVQSSLGRFWISEVQPEGKKPMPAADFLNGLRMKAGSRLETVPRFQAGAK